MKVTLVPEHTVPEGLAPMLTLTGKLVFTVSVIVFDVAGLPIEQLTFEVSTQVIASPLVGA